MEHNGFKLFYLHMGNRELDKLSDIRTIYGDQAIELSENSDCVVHALHFLDVLTDEENASKASSCTKGTSVGETMNLMETKYPGRNFVALSTTPGQLNSHTTLPPGTATIGILEHIDGGPSHAVVFVKDMENILYLVDKQNHVKFGCVNIEDYLVAHDFDIWKYYCAYETDNPSKKRKLSPPYVNNVRKTKISRRKLALGGQRKGQRKGPRTKRKKW